MSAEAPPEAATFPVVSRPSKVLFPDRGITKGDLADYYRRIAPLMLPHMADRPVTLQRFPDGIGGEGGFYQKEVPDHFPGWLRRVEVAKEGGVLEQLVCDRPESLVFLADQACITPHLWLSRADRPRRPDRMIFDLDPAGEAVAPLRRAARQLRSALAEVGLEAFLMTTGSRGFHLRVPLVRTLDFDEVRGLARALAERLADRHPDRLTIEQRKAARGKRIFVDYLRNGYGQTAVAPYAVRARTAAPVATPIDWQELGRTGPRSYTVENIFRRLGQKSDPWRRVSEARRDPRAARGELLS